MITQINGEGVKGLSFKQPLHKLNLFVGPNGAGKSARCAALMLTILGYAPTANGKPIRKNDEILDTFGDGKKMFAGIETDDKTHLLRLFSRENDSVSQVQMVDRKKATRETFGKALAGIKVLDLGAFLTLSDQKKVDAIFSIFPPASDLKNMDARIEELKEQKNRAESDLQALGSTIERLLKARADIELPSGTAAETDKAIAETESALKAARKALQEARVEIELKEVVAKAKADADIAVRKAVAEAEAKARKVPSADEPISAKNDIGVAKGQAQLAGKDLRTFSAIEEVEMSIRSILATMERTGCSSCAAALVCKREIKKYAKGAAA